MLHQYNLLVIYIYFEANKTTNQSGAAEAWWAHNPQVPGSKPGSDRFVFFFLIFSYFWIIDVFSQKLRYR